MEDTSRLDNVFVQIIKDWTKLSAESAEGAVVKILENSGNYLKEDHQKALQDFHNLYFADGEMAANKEAMNREVDDLFDAIQSEVAKGGDLSKFDNVSEDDVAKQSRLSLSGVQKKLESILQLESGIKEKLIPILTSMQFEDAIKQRLTHLAQLWRMAIDANPQSTDEVEVVGLQMTALLSSSTERRAFYPMVLKTHPPKDVADEVSWFDGVS